MYKIAIVEDEHESAEKLIGCINAYGEEYGIGFNLTHFKSGLDFLDRYSFDFDIVFMDIDMPQMNGLKVAKELRKVDRSVLLIFVTFLAKYAIKGYELDALDYLIKPLNYNSFKLKIDRALSRCRKRDGEEIILTTSEGSIRLNTDDLDYVEVNNHLITYHTTNGNYRAYGVMRSILGLLPPDKFCMCNRCYVVNLRNVTRIEGNSVIVGNSALTISRPRKKEFVDALHKYSLNRRINSGGG